LKAVKQGESGDVVRVLRFNTVDEEAGGLPQDISQRNPEDRKNCAVLARTKKGSIDLAGRKLEEIGVPVYYAARQG